MFGFGALEEIRQILAESPGSEEWGYALTILIFVLIGLVAAGCAWLALL